MTRTFEVETRGRSIVDITAEVRRRSEGQGGTLANVFVHHTSASLMINENADPDVLRDLESYFSRLVPDGDSLYRHVAEGPDDMPAHVRSALTATSLSVPVIDGRLALGTWQAIYLWEHRHAPHRRRITVTLV
ncbi:MAG: secondary thiamine-phosphate synthase enzyme YjbQ [Myxococcota bacterium]